MRPQTANCFESRVKSFRIDGLATGENSSGNITWHTCNVAPNK